MNLQLFDADEALQPLGRQIAVGEDPALDAQLVTKSRQPAILQYTPRDAQERFGNEQMLEKWRAKGREMHWLLGAKNDLGGIIWYGPAQFPLSLDLAEVPTETFAIRIYEGYSGHGLAVPFLKQSLRLHLQFMKEKNQPISGIWLQTSVNNPAALAAYSKLGYHEVFRDDAKVTMILSAAEVAEFA